MPESDYRRPVYLNHAE